MSDTKHPDWFQEAPLSDRDLITLFTEMRYISQNSQTVSFVPVIRASIELMRAINRFNRTSTWFAIALVFLGVVQLLLMMTAVRLK